MTPPPGYVRCNRTIACPICQRLNDGCMVHRDGKRAWCVRVESARPRENGWVHQIDSAPIDPATIKAEKKTIGIDIAGMASRFERGLFAEACKCHAAELGVNADSLKLLRVGWSKGDDAFTFPMRNAAGDVVGIRLRNHLGEKWSVRGGNEGLFYSSLRLAAETLYVTEGPTDTAAMLDLGLAVIGRPSCTGGVDHLLKLVRGNHHVVIVSDRDGPGVAGAESLADRLIGTVLSVKVIEPLHGKDVREWKTQYGLTADSLHRVVLNATPWCRRSPGTCSRSSSTSATRSAATTASNGSVKRPA